MIGRLTSYAGLFILIASGSVRAAGANGQSIPDEVMKRVGPSVVAVQHGHGTGSGFIISSDGYIISNGHVVRGNDSEDPTKPMKAITVILDDERKYPAKVLGFCMNPDVALLKIEPDEPLRPVVFADSSKAKVGQKCFAVGTPIGLKRTFTSGILSNVDRTDLGTFTIVFQTDAAINPGNSGGPLFDQNGRVLGINTYGTRGANNLGFTIPANVIKVVKNDLEKYGRFRRTDIPLFFVSEIYDELAAALKVDHGILVTYVMPGTAADRAGLKRGDIITEIDGKPVKARTRADLMDIEWNLATRTPGSAIEFTVMRGEPGKRKEWKIMATVELDEPTPTTTRFPGEVVTHYYDSLGLGYKGIVRLHRIQYRLPGVKGILVSSATANLPMGKAGVRKGDVITEVAGEPVDSVASFQKLMEKHFLAGDEYIDLTVHRSKITFVTALKPLYDMKGSKVALVKPRGDSDYLELIIRELISDGADLTLLTVDGKKPASPEIMSDISAATLAESKGGDFDVVIFLNGEGVNDLLSNTNALQLVKDAYNAGKIIAGLGQGAVTIVTAEPDLLEKKMTTAEAVSVDVVSLGAHYTGNDVEKDGKLLTTTAEDRTVVRSFLRKLRQMVRD